MSQEVVFKSVNSVREYENNPRVNDNSVELVKNSIREFGFNGAILVDKDNVIIAGHTRFRALKELGYTEIPCIVLDLPKDKANALRIADNKTAEISDWDYGKLEKELRSIIDDFNFVDFGFDKKYLDDIVKDYELDTKRELDKSIDVGIKQQFSNNYDLDHELSIENAVNLVQDRYNYLNSLDKSLNTGGSESGETTASKKMSITVVFDKKLLPQALEKFGMETYQRVFTIKRDNNG